jgi:hypothetical protein
MGSTNELETLTCIREWHGQGHLRCIHVKLCTCEMLLADRLLAGFLPWLTSQRYLVRSDNGAFGRGALALAPGRPSVEDICARKHLRWELLSRQPCSPRGSRSRESSIANPSRLVSVRLRLIRLKSAGVSEWRSRISSRSVGSASNSAR